MYVNAEEYMKSIQEVKDSVDNKRRQLKVLQNEISITSINYNLDKIRSSPNPDRLEKQVIDNIEKREKLQYKIEEEITEMLERQETAVNVINMIENKEQREVLMLRYIEGKSWSEILEIRGCDDIRSQYKLHQRALNTIQSLINDHSMTTT